MAISRSRIFLFGSVFLFVIQFFPQRVAASSNVNPNEGIYASRRRLIKHLTSASSPLLIPVTDNALNLDMDITVNGIQVDEAEMKFTVDAYFAQRWENPLLRWNASDYDNIDDVRIPAKLIWKPDIELYNQRGMRNPSAPRVNAYLLKTGMVTYIQPVTHSAVCAIDMSKYPFDIQTCKLLYGSWTYSALSINITSKFGPILDDYYVPNGKWEIVSATSEIKLETYPCCPESYTTYIVTFVLRRHFVYSCQILIFPAIVIAALIPFMFLLSSESKERITLGIALLVICVIQINVITSSLPKGIEKTPVILTYHVLTLILVALSVILSIFILNIYNRGPRRKRMPQILRTIFLKGLRRLVCLGDDTYNPTEEQESMSMRGVNQPSGDAEKAPQSSDGSMDEINKHMQSLAQRGKVLDARQEILAEWQQMAMVIDRILFILFLIIFVISTISLFPDASYKGIQHAL